jgi:hypothetical protein
VWANGLDVGGHFQDSAVRKFLAVSDIHQLQFSLRRRIHKHSGNDEWAEVIALSGFVDADALDPVAGMLHSHEASVPLGKCA